MVTEKAWSSQRDDLIDAKDRQLLIAVARSKELERELAAIKEDKVNFLSSNELLQNPWYSR